MLMRLAALGFVVFGTSAAADSPRVLDVSVTKAGMVWNVSVTLRHPDAGWNHFADGWEVLDAKGDRLGYRKLMHPHVEEQPFTRSLSGVVIPDGTREVFIRTHCSEHGWSDDLTRVELKP
ncbi:MAG: hypothetical protein AAGA28_19440 [Pseudomonadota bacterium]